MDVEWATRGLAFLLDNPADAEVIVREQLELGWRNWRDEGGIDRDAFAAGFRYALRMLGIPFDGADTTRDR
jgi:hypothetical protein